MNAEYLEQLVPFVRDRLKRAGIRLARSRHRALAPSARKVTARDRERVLCYLRSVAGKRAADHRTQRVVRDRATQDARRERAAALPAHQEHRRGVTRLASTTRRLVATLVGACLLASVSEAWAGMPIYSLTDVARLRLETISFFLVLLLVITALVRWAWNWYQRDAPHLPRLSYKGALGLIVVWGLALQLVLSMIAGARELMTPGAWVKVGATYQLEQAPAGSADGRDQFARRRDLERLRRTLWDYAAAHEGTLPPHEFMAGFTDAVWTTADPSGARFGYLGNRRTGEAQRIVAYEPGVFGRQRLVLYGDGQIREIDARDLARMLEADRR